MISNPIAENSETALMASIHRLSDAGGSVIQVRTREPLRAALVLRKHLIGGDAPYKEWDCVSGFRVFTRENLTEHRIAGDNKDFLEALSVPLQEIRNPNSECNARADKIHYFVYVNPHPYFANNPYPIELLQQYAAMLPSTNICTILVTPDIKLNDVPAGTVLVADLTTPTVAELEATLERTIEGAIRDKASFPGGSKISKEDATKIASMGLGLSLFEFETHVSISIIEAGERNEKALTKDRLMGGVSEGKTAVVRQSEILELIHPADIGNVGGMGRLKDWIAARTNCYSEEAKDFGIEPPRGMVLVGVPGCLTGDTLINITRKRKAGGHTRIRLDALFYRFNGLHDLGASKGLYHQGRAKEWDLSIPTKAGCYIEEGGYVGYNEIEGVVYSGVKEVLRLFTDHGYDIKATADHPFLTPSGYVPLRDLKPGDEILAYKDGVLVDSNATGRNRNQSLRIINNVGNHPYARRRTINGLDYSSYFLHRLVVEAHMNGMLLEDFLHALEGDTTNLVFLDEEVEVHHKDEDRGNNTRDNLETLSKAEHARLHMKERGNLNRYRTSARIQKVTSIVRIGKAPTYDIQMAAPNHNFVANGLVVHNCGKSLVAKACASLLEVPLVKLDFGRVFSKYVGDSESRVREALKMVEGMAPVVLFVDEVDKGLGGAGGGGDSGTSSRVLGSFLTWLQECTAPVFCVLTANKIDGLPPELLRRGRFDQIWSVGMPGADERKEVLAIHLRLRARDIKDFDDADIALFLAASDGYIPAEIESAVKDALVLAFNDTTKGCEGLEMRHIIAALKEMVPLSKSNKAHIDKIVAWAADNATPVSYPPTPPKTLAIPTNPARVLRAARRTQ